MDPNAPPAPPPAPMPSGGNQSPYDFIVNPEAKGKKSGSFGFGHGGSSTKTRLIVVCAGGVILIMIVIIFNSILSSHSQSSTQSLIDLAEQQQEIIRVAGLGLAQQAATPDSQNLAITTELSLQSSQKAILGLVDKKLVPKNLGGKKDTNTDAQLTLATQNGNFDATFVQIMDSELTAYNASLQTLYKNTSNTKYKQLFATSYKSTTLLINDPAVKNN